MTTVAVQAEQSAPSRYGSKASSTHLPTSASDANARYSSCSFSIDSADKGRHTMISWATCGMAPVARFGIYITVAAVLALTSCTQQGGSQPEVSLAAGSPASSTAGACTDGHEHGGGSHDSNTVCGLPIVTSPTRKPAYVCRDGVVILGPSAVSRAGGHKCDDEHEHHGDGHDGTVFTVTTTDPSTCITLLRDEGHPDHSISAARVYVDEQLIVDPGHLDEAMLMEKPLPLPPGKHAIRVVVESDAVVHLTVRNGGDLSPTALVRDDGLELFNLFAAPAPFSPAVRTLSLSAEGTVLQEIQVANRRQAAIAKWAFEIRSEDSCRVVRTIKGQTSAAYLWTLSIAATWDGRDDHGKPVRDGSYAYRLVASLDRKGEQHHHESEGELATALQRINADSTAPTIIISAPVNGKIYGKTVPVSVTWSDLGTSASGIAASSARITVGGVDVTNQLAVDDAGAHGLASVAMEGQQELRARVADRAGNTISAGVAFIVDVSPPKVEVMSPQPKSILRVPEVVVVGTAEDISPVQVTVNGSEVAVIEQAFVAGPLFLTEGLNTLTVTATDAVGNSTSVQLLVAYTLADAAVIIDAQGGRVEYHDGFTASAEIPAGAVTDPTVVTITLTPPPLRIEAAAGVSPPLRFTSTNPFVGAVTVMLEYDESAVAMLGSAESAVGLLVLHEGSRAWESVGDAAVDVAGNTVSSQVGGFSILQAVVQGHASAVKLARSATPQELSPPLGSEAQLAGVAVGFDGSLVNLVRHRPGDAQRASLLLTAPDSGLHLRLGTTSATLSPYYITEMDSVSAPTRRPQSVGAVAAGSKDNGLAVAVCDQPTPEYPCDVAGCKCRIMVLNRQ
jgi:hypothetical protein